MYRVPGTQQRTLKGQSLRYYALALLCGVLFAGSAYGDCDDLAAPRALPTTAAGGWSLATFNLWRLRDTEKDRPLDEPLHESVYRARLQALADYIVDTLKAPVLLAVQEVEGKAVILKQLADQIVAHGGPRYRFVLQEGNDPSGMNVALLHRPPAQVTEAKALFTDRRFRNQPLYSRPPLAVTLTAPEELTLVVVHLRSGRGLNEKAWVAEKRRRQAARLAAWAQTRNDTFLALAGDFNSAPSSGKFSEPIGLIAETGLYNSWQHLKADERYSYRHQCQPQTLDYIWLSAPLKANLSGVAVSRGNAGRYSQLYENDGTEVVSDHEALVTFFQ